MSNGLIELEVLEDRVIEVAGVLRSLANPRRLLLLCKLAEAGRMSVNDLATALALSQPAVSQHLALLRDEQIVTFERDGQTLFYRIQDRRIEALLGNLYQIYCAPEGDGDKQ
jgi:ArsR family transcriptional regulator, virulence genes transcriptional regulator